MLAYAAHRRAPRHLSPTALVLIIAGHGLALALLITARLEVPVLPDIIRTEIRDIPLPKEPPPPTPKPWEQPKLAPSPPDSHLDRPPTKIELPLDAGPIVPPGPSTDIVTSLVGNSPDLGPPFTPAEKPKPAPIRTAANFITPPDLVRPPYPESKRHEEQGARLRLRLSIDERGRVTAVESVGTADAQFLSAARQHLMRHWRYKPATEDGRAVPTTLTITLRFLLED